MVKRPSAIDDQEDKPPTARPRRSVRYSMIRQLPRTTSWDDEEEEPEPVRSLPRLPVTSNVSANTPTFRIVPPPSPPRLPAISNFIANTPTFRIVGIRCPSQPAPVINKLDPHSRFFKIMTDPCSADVILVLANGKEIPSHRYILAQKSDVFADIIEKAEQLLVRINIDTFSKDTVQSALIFLYGKSQSIIGKVLDVYKFAKTYEISELIAACCSKMEESVTDANVCESIHIAYSNDLDRLKTKCLKILNEKKEEMGAARLAALPNNILVDVLLFKP